MTPAQTKTIERIKQTIVKQKSCGNPDGHEFKKVEIRESEDSTLVFLVTEYGSKTDEGTLASLICRDYRHFMIGPRGGVKLISLSSNLRTSDPGRDEGHGIFNAVNWYHKPKKETDK